ncbi:hypothetical protein LTR10_016888 [Elasticomyces elasticus]|uniref:Uncharacterized protein n=1 Tax=Exophiala sideris TaxID=1016849 RepID=A0ABR0JK76_9EURO|nr:hypothetical protein LTR10_016888 [Elasticomyces elasticus]KAK5035343.1 hypothetical protein LTS07_002779 [Exophiala sideris]KAK5039306.1 hypothetical protein LTR13_003563 [Exophiala sideris]KAK5066267.1 hypothetical protein LTR69_002785 [Exophiala sideris]KAK5186944.1 hypothetical protein LTR44_000950 [Eurotiomycetes sp. CCFEE 6388]
MAGSPRRRVVINNNVLQQHAHTHNDNDLKKAQLNLDAAKTTLSVLQERMAKLEGQMRELKGPMVKAEQDVHRARCARDMCAEKEKEDKKRRERERQREREREHREPVFMLVRR